MSNAPRKIRRDTRFFISAVTRELGSVRKLVKKGLEDTDHHAVEQDNFPPDYRDLVDKLRERIDSCDAVIHIAGHAYGAEPAHRPPDAPRRSYTQIEYDLAVELGKPLYVFLTGDGFPTDPHDPEPPELRELQEAHRRRLAETGRDYNPTASAEQLDQKVRGLRLKVERLEGELYQVDQEVAATGHRLRNWLALVAMACLAALGAVGHVAWRQRVEQRAQEAERARQEVARKAQEDDRREAQKVKDVYREVAEGVLQELLADKQITTQEARRRAMEKLPRLVKLPPAEIESLIDRKIPRATEASLSPLDRARAALSKGDYRAVLPLADEEARKGREMAMVEGTAALALFRQSPSPQWNERALAAFRRAMAAGDPNSEGEWEAWTEAAASAASVLDDVARYAEAEPLLRECLRLREARSGPNSPGVAVVLNDLAELLRVTDRPSEAEPLYLRALAISERSLGPDHPQVATRLNNLASLLRATDRPSEAEPLFRRAVAVGERSKGPDHPDVAIRLHNLALLLKATNRPSEAEPLLARAVCILLRFQRSTGHEHPNLRNFLGNYRTLLTSRKLAEPEIAARLRAAGEGTGKLSPIAPEVERLLGAARPVADVLASLDRKYKEQGKPAVFSLGPADPIAPHLDELLGPDGAVLNATGVAASRRGSHADAVVLFEAALGLMADQPSQAAARLKTRMNRAVALRELGLVEPAREELSGLLPEFEKMTPADARMNGLAHYHLALCQWRLGERAAARASAERSLAIYDGAPQAEPVAPGIRQQSEQLLGALKEGKAPPPPAAIDAPAALEAARARYRAREALAKLGLKEPAAPLLDQVLGPARPTKEVLDALDRGYREQGRPPVWFLPPGEPIAPHLEGLLGKPPG